jgi:hypothetical protein
MREYLILVILSRIKDYWGEMIIELAISLRIYYHADLVTVHGFKVHGSKVVFTANLPVVAKQTSRHRGKSSPPSKVLRRTGTPGR